MPLSMTSMRTRSSCDAFEADGDPALADSAGDDGVLGVAEQVDQDLQHLVLFGQNVRKLVVVADDLDVVAGNRLALMRMRIVDQAGQRKLSRMPETPAYDCCMRDDLLDVVDVLRQRVDLFQDRARSWLELLAQLDQEARQMLARGRWSDERARSS